jgi:hypothetical protein
VNKGSHAEAARFDEPCIDTMQHKKKINMPIEDPIDTLARALTTGDGIPRFIDAGYTYLGQFIAHDIVPERSGGRLVRPYLQLDSLYGDDHAYLILRDSLFDIRPSIDGGPDDLPRGDDGVACIPERRNDDNVIVAQFHVLWQRFHNLMLTSGCAGDFAEARRLTTLTFQLVVVEDYLRQVLAPNVYYSYFHHGERWLGLDPTRIPREFSHAAFRFGHSMVRAKYRSLPGHPRSDVDVGELFRARRPLSSEYRVDWKGFFGWPGAPAQSSLAINTYITPAMRSVPKVSGAPGDTVDVVLANLRASGSPLPPGKACAERCGVAPLKRFDKCLAERLHPFTVDTLPLWPYLLLEAQLESGGRRLGQLGSIICAETLANAVALAAHSIFVGRTARLEDVLDDLGLLGRRIRAMQRARGSPPREDRSFSMRHVLALLDPS